MTSCISGFDKCKTISGSNKQCHIDDSGTVSSSKDDITCNLTRSYDYGTKNDALTSEDTSAGMIERTTLYCPGSWQRGENNEWKCDRSETYKRCSNTAAKPATKDYIPSVPVTCSCWKDGGFGTWKSHHSGTTDKVAQQKKGAFGWSGHWHILGTDKNNWRSKGDPRHIGCNKCNCALNHCEKPNDRPLYDEPNYNGPFGANYHLYPETNSKIKKCLKKDEKTFEQYGGNQQQCAIDDFRVARTGLVGDCEKACKERDAGAACGHTGSLRFERKCESGSSAVGRGTPHCYYTTNDAQCVCSGCDNKLTGKWVNTGTMTSGTTNTAVEGITHTHAVSVTSTSTMGAHFDAPIKAITGTFSLSATESKQITDSKMESSSKSVSFSIPAMYAGKYSSDGAFWQWEVCYNENSPDCPGFCYMVPPGKRFAMTPDSSKPPCCTEASVCPMQGNSPCNGGRGQLKDGYCTGKFEPEKDAQGELKTSCW